jgi:glycosyltransferase involved in cell wall biosynthesis
MALRISIITPSFNQAAFLGQTLDSVLNQGYERLEYIVIDGASTDQSAEILKRYGERLAYWVSEADRGQVHAINKGLARATGEIVAYLNSDDVYLPGALEAVAGHFRRYAGCSWLCGDTILFGKGRPTEVVKTVVPTDPGQCASWAYRAPQPGMFWRRAVLSEGFDERWRYCFDHELYLRLLLRGYRCDHLAIPLAAYRLHGSSKTVGEPEGFEQEFDAVAAFYEPKLPWRARRWSRATRLLRASYAQSRSGLAGRSASLLLRALLLHPEGIMRRPFWGCLRATVRAVMAR